MAVSTSEAGSWADDLSPAFLEPSQEAINTDLVDVPPEDTVSTDETRIVNPPANACVECGEEIVREPGSRGRLPKRHKWCVPTKAGSTASAPRTVKVIAATKADQAKAVVVEGIVARFDRALSKAIILLSIVDEYDALVLQVNKLELLENVYTLLMKSDKLRAFASTADTGGSIFGLVTSILTIVLPIAAHHGLIPKSKIQQMILRTPLIMYNIQQAAEQSGTGDFTMDLLNRIQVKQDMAARARARAETDGSNVSTPTG